MWQVNCNYNRDNTDTKCPLCQKSEDTTEHVLECGKAKKFTLRKTLKKIVKKTVMENGKGYRDLSMTASVSLTILSQCKENI